MNDVSLITLLQGLKVWIMILNKMIPYLLIADEEKKVERTIVLKECTITSFDDTVNKCIQ